MAAKIETDVLVVGSGPAGGASAALLSMYGVKNVMITKYGWLADTPRAHITNQRAMEVLRDLGVEREAMLYATPQELMALLQRGRISIGEPKRAPSIEIAGEVDLEMRSCTASQSCEPSASAVL